VQFSWVGIEKYGHELIGHKVLGTIPVEGFHTYICIHDRGGISSKFFEIAGILDLIEIEICLRAIYEIEDQAIGICRIGYQIGTIGIDRSLAKESSIILCIIVLKDMLRQDIIVEEHQIVFGGCRESDLELIISILEDDKVAIHGQLGDIPFVAADDVVVREIQVIGWYRRPIGSDRSFFERNRIGLIVRSLYIAQVRDICSAAVEFETAIEKEPLIKGALDIIAEIGKIRSIIKDGFHKSTSFAAEFIRRKPDVLVPYIDTHQDPTEQCDEKCISQNPLDEFLSDQQHGLPTYGIR
jgi:hypothetical protein